MSEQVDVAVVGAGPAGLHAALAAAQAGAQVILIDAHHQPGGQYFKLRPAEFTGSNEDRRQREGRALWRHLDAAGVRLLSDTTVWGLFEGRLLALDGPNTPKDLAAGAVIVASGAYDRPVAFPGWTLPGVITTGAAQLLVRHQHILPGKRIVLAGTGPLQLVVAAELAQAGAEVVAVLEGARIFQHGWRHLGALWGQWTRLQEGLSSRWTLCRRRIPYRAGWGIVAARGDEQLVQVTIARLDEQWRPMPGTEEVLDCDTLCLGYGFVTSAGLTQLAGAEHRWRPELGGLVPQRDEHMQTSVPGIYAVGDGAGVGGAALAMIEGQIAGLAAAAQLGYLAAGDVQQAYQRLQPELVREQRFQRMYVALFTPGPGLYELARDDTLICRCEEVTQAEIRRVIALGADSANEVKVTTRCGMGNCQGRVCGQLVAHLVARETGRSVAEVGLFRPRPPLYPLPVEVFAGELPGKTRLPDPHFT